MEGALYGLAVRCEERCRDWRNRRLKCRCTEANAVALLRASETETEFSPSRSRVCTFENGIRAPIIALMIEFATYSDTIKRRPSTVENRTLSGAPVGRVRAYA